MAASLAMAVVLAVGCGGGSSPSQSGTAFPTGKWTRVNDAGVTLVMEFRTDGTWAFDRGGEGTSTGTYSTDDGTLTFKTDTLCQEQNAEQGTYTWTYANGQLTFKKQDDKCAVGRVTTFDGPTWTPAK